MDYTVEVTTAPVVNDDWSLHVRAVDNVPGTMLLQDPEQPMLVFPVEADDPMKAARFVDGLATLLGLRLVRGNILPAPEEDFDVYVDDQPEQSSPLVDKLNAWVDDSGKITDELSDAAQLICA